MFHCGLKANYLLFFFHFVHFTNNFPNEITCFRRRFFQTQIFIHFPSTNFRITFLINVRWRTHKYLFFVWVGRLSRNASYQWVTCGFPLKRTLCHSEWVCQVFLSMVCTQENQISLEWFSLHSLVRFLFRVCFLFWLEMKYLLISK